MEHARSLEKRWLSELESVKPPPNSRVSRSTDASAEAQSTSASASLSTSADRLEESSAAAAETLVQEQAAAYNVQLDLELYLKKSDDLVEHMKETGAECLRSPAFATASISSAASGSGSASASASDDRSGAPTKSKRGSPQKQKQGHKSARLHKQSAPSLQAVPFVTSVEALSSISYTDSPDGVNAQPPPAGAGADAVDATAGALPSVSPAESTDGQLTAPTERSSPHSGEALITVIKPSHRMLPNFTLNHVVLIEKCA